MRSLLKKAFDLKKLSGYRKYVFLTVLSLVWYYVVLSLTLSFFTSTDEVSNRLFAKCVGLDLMEPGWDQIGRAMAAAAEPGMVIPKDPYAQNTGEMDMVVRLRLEVRLDQSNAQFPQGNNYITPANDTERKVAILKALMDEKNNAVLTITTPPSTTAKGNAVIITGEDNQEYYIRCNQTRTDADENEYCSFLIEAEQKAGSEAFDLIFYYIGGNPIGGVGQYMYDENHNPLGTMQTQMAVLTPGTCTPRLFDRIIYPLYKKDYLTIFDQGYTINVYAEGILLQDFEERGLPYTIENFKQLASA